MSANAAGYTLYGADQSGSAAIEAALTWGDIPFRRVEAAPWEPWTGFEALKRVNPLAQIPTLVLPDGTVVTETAAILVHLGLEHPDSGLLPRDPGARAHAMRGLVYVSANCYAAVGISDFPERWLVSPDEASRDNLRHGARQRLASLWEVFADTFPATPWLGGSEPGALDLLATVVSKWSGARSHLRANRPELYALFGRVEAHPRVSALFEQHWPAR